ncbi:DUF4097 family beta strand repeat-containing protein [Actinomadura rupiterrae]|uniref:DUF4097 family beta strand repeat-containing protein n=1 Tax=Actinomadura rupiterrae TaxID=559627 RepID=UPI0020A2B5AA|nr:DUF4097 family beta strand repeat-containing protein [Actinomadura rupiterrae]MCP2340059.1 hypothetical protein [Actinomadura rupiterrae]
MSRWTIDEPTTLEFDGVVALRATLIAGSVSVVAGTGRPSVHVDSVDGPPLQVAHEAGMLAITHEKLIEGVLSWLRTQKASAHVTVTVPADCPVSLNLVSADAVITGIHARTQVRSATGDVTLHDVAGDIEANTVSGDVEASGLDGRVTFISASGELALAGGSLDRLAARSISGRVSADVELRGEGRTEIQTVSADVAVRLPEHASTRVVLNSGTGRVEASFPELARQDRAIARSVSGKLGDGSADLTVNTISGNVTLLSRPAHDALED